MTFWRGIIRCYLWGIGWGLTWRLRCIWVILFWIGERYGCVGSGHISNFFLALLLYPGGTTTYVGGVLTLVSSFFRCPYFLLVGPLIYLPLFLSFPMFLLMIFSLLWCPSSHWWVLEILLAFPGEVFWDEVIFACLVAALFAKSWSTLSPFNILYSFLYFLL